MSGAGKEAEVAAVLEKMTALGMWEWRLYSFDGLNLTLAGGQDMVYSHHAQATFHDVLFIQCPVRVRHPRFREATHLEVISSGASSSLDAGSTAIAIESESDSPHAQVFVIVAASVELKVETVVYSEMKRETNPGG